MSKQLVITEKPSVARDIAQVLGGFVDHAEYFENDQYVITFALGHLLELSEPEDYDKAWRGWTLASLPILPDRFTVKPKEGQKKRLDVIKKLATRKDVGGIINACDAGREGEVIFRRIIEYCELDGRPHHRLWLQSMTAEAIRAGFEHLRPGEDLDHLADAAWLRSVGDWLIGMNATRALTRRLKGKREKGVWSAGRVQTPTLMLLVEREKEVLAHEPQTYWEIDAKFHAADHGWSGRYHDPTVSDSEERDQRPSRIFDRARVDAVLAAVATSPVGVAAEKRKKSRQNPPLMFDLTTLQREANRRFSFSAKRTLNTAQRLYETHKVLTYPRTDSRHLPSDYGETVTRIVDALTLDAVVGSAARTIQAEGPKNLEIVLDGTKVSDHFAIVPTGTPPTEDMSPDDRKIYELVVRQFLAALMGPATWAVVERTVEVPVPGAAPALFRTTARTLEIPGFLEAAGFEEGDGTTLPALQPGSDVAQGVPTEIVSSDATEKETRPPSRLSEAALLRLMETAGERMGDEELADVMKGRGLGTPATRADTIERLLSTGYAVRVEGKLAPTPKAMRLMDILERAHVPGLSSPKLTGKWEYDLKQVEAGNTARDEALASFIAFTSEVTSALKGFEHEGLFATEPSLGVCPSCGQGQVVETVWGYRCTRNEMDAEDGCRFFLWKERSGRYVDRKLATRLVRDRASDRVIGFIDRFGRALEGRIVLEAESPTPGSQMNMKIEFGASSEEGSAEVVGGVVFPCPCGEPDCEGVVETTHRFVCQRVLDGRAKSGPLLPRSVCSRAVELEEAAAFFGEAGKTELLTGFTSRRGRPFSGMLVRRESGKHGFEFPERPGGRGRKGPSAADGEAGEPGEEGEAASGARKPASGAARSRRKGAEDGEAAKPKRKTAADAKAPKSKRSAAAADAESETAVAEGGATVKRPTRSKAASAAAPGEEAPSAPSRRKAAAAGEPAPKPARRKAVEAVDGAAEPAEKKPARRPKAAAGDTKAAPKAKAAGKGTAKGAPAKPAPPAPKPLAPGQKAKRSKKSGKALRASAEPS